MPSNPKKLTKAQQALVEENLWIAESMAKSYWKKTGGYQDDLENQQLTSQAYIGLCLAAQKWDKTRGPFSAYARLIITYELDDEYKKSLLLVRIPDKLEPELRKIREAVKLGHNTIDAVASYLKFSKKKVIELWPYQHDGFIEIEKYDSHNDQEETPEMEAMTAEMYREIRAALVHLNPRQRKVIDLRFGFTTGSMKTTAEIAKRFQMNVETVKKLEAEAIEILQAEIKQSSLGYLNLGSN